MKRTLLIVGGVVAVGTAGYFLYKGFSTDVEDVEGIDVSDDEGGGSDLPSRAKKKVTADVQLQASGYSGGGVNTELGIG